MPTGFEPIFLRLRAILRKHRGKLAVKQDSPDCYCLEGGLHPMHKTPFPIAWVQVGKACVSYHLIPMYGSTKLLDPFSEKLKARKQGKSCFNFKVMDEALFAELEELTVKALAVFNKTSSMREQGKAAANSRPQQSRKAAAWTGPANAKTQ